MTKTPGWSGDEPGWPPPPEGGASGPSRFIGLLAVVGAIVLLVTALVAAIGVRVATEDGHPDGSATIPASRAPGRGAHPLEVVETGFTAGTTEVSVGAEIRNPAPRAVGRVRVRVTVKAADGGTIGLRTEDVEGVGAGATVPFGTSVGAAVPAAAASVEVVADGSDLMDGAPAAMVVRGVRIEDGRYGKRVVGTVVSSARDRLTDVVVACAFRRSGTIVGGGLDRVGRVPATGSASFAVTQDVLGAIAPDAIECSGIGPVVPSGGRDGVPGAGAPTGGTTPLATVPPSGVPPSSASVPPPARLAVARGA